MRIAVIGAGRMGRALGGRWADAGHDVVYGVRDVDDPKVADLPQIALVQEAARNSEAVLIALPWAVTREVVSGLEVGNAVVMDATNPLAAGARELQADPPLSGAELVRTWMGGARVVKAFNTTGSGNVLDPDYGNQQPLMLVAGDDGDAKSLAIGLANDIGFAGVDAGPLPAARDLEHLAMLWIRLAYPLGNGPNIAFALLRR